MLESKVAWFHFIVVGSSIPDYKEFIETHHLLKKRKMDHFYNESHFQLTVTIRHSILLNSHTKLERSNFSFNYGSSNWKYDLF